MVSSYIDAELTSFVMNYFDATVSYTIQKVYYYLVTKLGLIATVLNSRVVNY